MAQTIQRPGVGRQRLGLIIVRRVFRLAGGRVRLREKFQHPWDELGIAPGGGVFQISKQNGTVVSHRSRLLGPVAFGFQSRPNLGKGGFGGGGVGVLFDAVGVQRVAFHAQAQFQPAVAQRQH